MGEVVDIAAILKAENPKVKDIDLRVFGDALRTYLEAAANITANGAIVAHPRTGAPIENPYLKVRTQTGAVLARMSHIRSNRVLELLKQAAP